MSHCSALRPIAVSCVMILGGAANSIHPASTVHVTINCISPVEVSLQFSNHLQMVWQPCIIKPHSSSYSPLKLERRSLLSSKQVKPTRCQPLASCSAYDRRKSDWDVQCCMIKFIKAVMQADVAGGILMMRAPAGRGLVAIGNAAGQLVLADPRTGTLRWISVAMLAVSPHVLACDCSRLVRKEDNMTPLGCSIRRTLGCHEQQPHHPEYQQFSAVTVIVNSIQNVLLSLPLPTGSKLHHVHAPFCSRALPNQSGRVSGLSHSKCNSQAQDDSNCNTTSTQQYRLGQLRHTWTCCTEFAVFCSAV